MEHCQQTMVSGKCTITSDIQNSKAIWKKGVHFPNRCIFSVSRMNLGLSFFHENTVSGFSHIMDTIQQTFAILTFWTAPCFPVFPGQHSACFPAFQALSRIPFLGECCEIRDERVTFMANIAARICSAERMSEIPSGLTAWLMKLSLTLCQTRGWREGCGIGVRLFSVVLKHGWQ